MLFFISILTHLAQAQEIQADYIKFAPFNFGATFFGEAAATFSSYLLLPEANDGTKILSVDAAQGIILIECNARTEPASCEIATIPHRNAYKIELAPSALRIRAAEGISFEGENGVSFGAEAAKEFSALLGLPNEREQKAVAISSPEGRISIKCELRARGTCRVLTLRTL